jgi:hypothetical protein
MAVALAGATMSSSAGAARCDRRDIPVGIVFVMGRSSGR